MLSRSGWTARKNNVDVTEIDTYLDACSANFIEYRVQLVKDGIVRGHKLCYRVMDEDSLFRLKDSYFYVTVEIKKILTGDTKLIQKTSKFITRGLR